MSNFIKMKYLNIIILFFVGFAWGFYITDNAMLSMKEEKIIGESYSSIDEKQLSNDWKNYSYIATTDIFDNNQVQGKVIGTNNHVVLNNQEIFTSSNNIAIQFSWDNQFVIIKEGNGQNITTHKYNIWEKKLFTLENNIPQYSLMNTNSVYENGEKIDSASAIYNFITDESQDFYAYIRDNNKPDDIFWAVEIIINWKVINTASGLQNMQFSDDKKTYIYHDSKKNLIYVHKDGQDFIIENAQKAILSANGKSIIYNLNKDGYHKVIRQSL